MSTSTTSKKTTSKNYTLGLILAVSFLAAANVKADFLTSQTYEYAISTAGNAEWWQVASLLQHGDSGYINPSKNTSTNKYTNAGTMWKDLANDNYLADAAWGNTVQGTRSTWKSGGGARNWVGIDSDDNKMPNGFYAFKYSMYTLSDDTSVSGSLSLTLGADDYITAIYANGDLLYGSTLAVGETASDKGWLGTLDTLFFDEVALINGVLDLVFVIHNTNLAGTNDANNKSNAMGLFVNGILTTSVLMSRPDGTGPDNVVVPEPATLAVFGLGLAGLGLVQARRRK